MLPSRSQIVRAFLAVSGVAFISACGDSSGPGSVDAEGALQSLAIGIGQTDGVGSPTTPDITASFAGFASHLGTADVTIGGASRKMFAMGFRETFPEGTCMETLFLDPAFPPPPGECTSPTLGLVLVLWQSHSAHEPPDRILVLVADEGTSDFTFDIDQPDLDPIPALAFYIEGQNNAWASVSGSLTSQISSLNQPCNTPLPPYAKAGSCSFASFDEQGAMVLEPLTIEGPSGLPLAISIPRQTVFGLWLAITEVQPITLPLTATRLVPQTIQQRVSRIVPNFGHAR